MKQSHIYLIFASLIFLAWLRYYFPTSSSPSSSAHTPSKELQMLHEQFQDLTREQRKMDSWAQLALKKKEVEEQLSRWDTPKPVVVCQQTDCEAELKRCTVRIDHYEARLEGILGSLI